MTPNAAQPASVDHTGLFDYTRHLLTVAENPGDVPKSKRTRLRIIAATSRILAQSGYHELCMADIATEIRISHGAVYRYFENKRAVTFEVLSGYGVWGAEKMIPPGEAVSAYERIRSTTSHFVALFRANIGLSRCSRQLSDEHAEFARLQQELNAGWYHKVAAGIARRAATTDRAAEEAFSVASAIGGMVDEMLHNVFVLEDRSLTRFRRSPDELVTMLSILWFRAAFAENPPAAEVKGSHAVLELRGDALDKT